MSRYLCAGCETWTDSVGWCRCTRAEAMAVDTGAGLYAAEPPVVVRVPAHRDPCVGCDHAVGTGCAVVGTMGRLRAAAEGRCEGEMRQDEGGL